MMKMNYMSDKLKNAEKKLINISSYSLQSIFLVTEGKTINEALVNNEKLIPGLEALKHKGIVKKYSGVSSLFISDSLQQVRIERWKKYLAISRYNRRIDLRIGRQPLFVYLFARLRIQASNNAIRVSQINVVPINHWRRNV